MRLNADRISTGTLVLDLKTIRSVFSSARRQGLVLHNPADAAQLPVNRPMARDVFTPEDIRTLLRVAADEWQTVILLGYYRGGRLGDMVRLSWDSVELATSTIFYQQGKTRTRVEVPIHPDLEARLLAIAGDNPRGLLCPTLARTRVDGRRGLSRQFAHLMSAAALDQDQVRSARNAFSRKSVHSLRHSFSSALANAAVSADVRMKLTGHKSLDVHRRYTHVEMEPLKHAIAALPRLAGENEA
jgi:integrase